MLRRLGVPWIEEGFDTVRVVCWHACEGQTLALGTVVCELESSERRVQGPRRFADDGSRRALRRRRKPSSGAAERTSNRIRVHVLALEPGVLDRVLAGEGAEVHVGGALALCRDLAVPAGDVQDHAGEPVAADAVPGDVADLSDFRVDAQVIQEDDL